MRIIEMTDTYELPWDRHDVEVLFSIALNPKGASPEQAHNRIEVPDGFPPYAAQRLIDLLVAPVRLDLHLVAIGAAEQLGGSPLPLPLEKLAERARRIMAGRSRRDFAHVEALQRLHSLLTERPT